MKLKLAENIRAFRKERRLTQEQFAEAMGVTVGSVYKWETLLLNIFGLVESVVGYALVLSSRREYADAKRVLSGLIEYLESFKEGEKADFADKIMASMYTVMAYIHTLEGKPAEAAECLRGVLAAVRKFDAAPDYGIRILHYPVHRTDVILNDVLGATAADSIETILPSLKAHIVILFILGILSNVVSGIFNPAAGAMLPNIVEPQQLQQANAYL